MAVSHGVRYWVKSSQGLHAWLIRNGTLVYDMQEMGGSNRP